MSPKEALRQVREIKPGRKKTFFIDEIFAVELRMSLNESIATFLKRISRKEGRVFTFSRRGCWLTVECPVEEEEK